eukprot:TRINITY_DN19890_c0_g1_i1.p2 TRINITY_DN19890_c0_g1~~TRINITY_DN19890_c0_g1_i1.p2  ORF type:complete len:195 (-),score=24.24 TRINITY_DN19890_c0_g1_i1:23-607(-)
MLRRPQLMLKISHVHQNVSQPNTTSIFQFQKNFYQSYYTRRTFQITCQTSTDEQYMRQALQLAENGVGKTNPNPAVGCVIVKDGEVVGQGYHEKAGGPHAEVFALRAAGNLAEGATAYVTLEPCNHFGRTPPCSVALIQAGVKRVVIGVVDPNPLVGGAGVRRLRDANIDVVAGCLENQCYEINKEFMQRMQNS